MKTRLTFAGGRVFQKVKLYFAGSALDALFLPVCLRLWRALSMVTLSDNQKSVNDKVNEGLASFAAARRKLPPLRFIKEVQFSAWKWREWDSECSAAARRVARLEAARKNGLVRKDISLHEGGRVFIYADMVKLKKSGVPGGVGGGSRGRVAGFSRQSRKRMIERLAQIRDPETRNGLFITLTFPDEVLTGLDGEGVVNWEFWHRCFDVFMRRFERKFPGAGAVWRLEMKRRLSGIWMGFLAPHFHSIIYLDEKFDGERLAWLRRWVAGNWFEVVGSGLEKHLKAGSGVEVLYGRAHASRYLSKYIAKVDFETLEVGRRWGSRGNLDARPLLVRRLSRQVGTELKRGVRLLLKSRGVDYAKRLAGSSSVVGWSAYGVGGCSRLAPRLQSSAVYRLLHQSILLARDHPKEFEENRGILNFSFAD